ncbi:BRCA1-associated protein [Hypsibius exemplaris]|uniref:BRCA1-associated protein n=1 Tax=Hypsibius exemplaris TaxID=2072580 RepID=A0A1W0WPZ3_HYPEX|nr:BRCA1-associated protein [Hypsibius exemplaris]
MSVCLVHLRLELPSKSSKPSHFNFSTDKYSTKRNEPVAPRFYDSKAEFLAAIEAARGKRPFRSYTIETYSPDKSQKAMEEVGLIPVSERPVLRSRTTSGSTVRSETGEARSDFDTNDEYCVQFYYGNPSVEMVKGVLHLYRDNERTSLKPTAVRSTLLCMLAVPAHLSTGDLLRFSAPFSTEIQKLKIIRDQTPNQYMVLFRFKNQESADRFYDHFNGVPFNSIEPGICHLAYVAKVDAVEDIDGGGMAVDGLTELPTCAFCLERMDEAANGVLTILCNHSFHSACLEQWGDSSCPVCRYFQTPQMAEEQACFQCGMSSDDLWLCLICGNIGCGRYSEKHAFVHFQETQHTYALNVKTRRVWDYVGDGYVHRLIQGSGADKVVEYNHAGAGNIDEKMESVTLEYTYLLTTQLESQRHYYEERMEDVRRAAEEECLHLRTDLEALRIASGDTTDTVGLQQKQLAQLLKDKESLEKKYQQATVRLVKLSKDLQSEKQLNSILETNQNDYRQLVDKLRKEKEDAVTACEKEIADLREQLADLMYHMETGDRIAVLPDAARQDIEGGRILSQDKPVEESLSGSAKKANQRRRNR